MMDIYNAETKPWKRVNVGHPKTQSKGNFWILLPLSLLLSTLACISPSTPISANLTPLPPDIWWTNTPATNDISTGVFNPPPTSNPQVNTPPFAPATSEATPIPNNAPPLLYYTQAGDTLPVVAVRFGVQSDEISSPDPLPSSGLLPPNQLLIIPHRLANTTSSAHLLPDSELVYSPSATDFDVSEYVDEAGGYLNEYREYLHTTGWTSGADIIQRVATENSINPRLLLALLEYQSGWVLDQPQNLSQREYPLGYINLNQKDLYHQLAWAVNQLSIGYYGWREGLLTELRFSDGAIARLAPELNAGTVALQYFFAQIRSGAEWIKALDEENGFIALYHQMFGNPWVRAVYTEPLYPPDLQQPPLILPFLRGQLWHYTGGPHGAWEKDGARAALDFAPSSSETGCAKSNHWVLAAAPGLIVRSGNGVVVIDLDGDGYEQTNWVLLYLHVDILDSIRVGLWVETGDRLGHPSCIGGKATGTHLHIARKYNGEWIAADGPLPMVLGGWTAHAGNAPYEGTLTRDGKIIKADLYGSISASIMRTNDDP
ncbi:MAG: hypothetical protein AB1345_08005 [Chloroflexota bacterium]